MPFTLPTHDYTPTHPSKAIVKFSDDTIVVRLISDDVEVAYRMEVTHLREWDCDLTRNASQTQEIIVDFRRTKINEFPLHNHGDEVECVKSIKFLGVYIRKDLTWVPNTTHLVGKAQQSQSFLRPNDHLPQFHYTYPLTWLTSLA